MLITLVCALGLTIQTAAQDYPANVITTLQPPYSVYLADFADPITHSLNANVTFLDFNEPSWQARLKVTIESNRIRVETKPEFQPAPISLVSGVSKQISGIDLSEYLRLENVNISGEGQQNLLLNGRLPEGMYSFCIEVLDYTTGDPISKPSCSNAWLTLNDPPVIISPSCNGYVPALSPQNVMFQWQLRGNSPNTTLGVDYEMQLFEMLEPTMDAQSALMNSQVIPIYTSNPTSFTSLQYDLSAPPLEVGKSYVYQIKATDQEQRDVFKNGGLSEVCWFHYGYPENRVLTLFSIDDKHKIGNAEVPYFSWSSPDLKVSGQPFTYTVNMVELDNENEDPNLAVTLKEPYFDSTFKTTMSANGNGIILPKSRFRPNRWYAWQVQCHSKDQMVAESEVRTFKGPNLVQRFFAGYRLSREVWVSEVENDDPTNLNGKGWFMMNGDTLKVEFEGIGLVKTGEKWRMRSGEVIATFEDPLVIPLTPDLEENGPADFSASKLKLLPESLELGGTFDWDLPHPTMTDQAPQLVTPFAWVNYDTDKLIGGIELDGTDKYVLLDPLKFELTLSSESQVSINDNVFYFDLQGKVRMPDNVIGRDDQRVDFEFEDATQLYSLNGPLVGGGPEIFPAQNANILFAVNNYTIDLSERESPGNFQNEPDWKGVFIEQFDFKIEQFADKYKQLYVKGGFSKTLNSSPTDYVYVSAQGLNAKAVESFPAVSGATFNEFPTNLKKYKIVVVNSALSANYITGSIKIPVLSDTKDFDYKIPISTLGFQEGYLTSNVDNTTHTFSPDGGEQRMLLKIDQATFMNNDRLVMTVDVEWPELDLKMTNLKGFSVWGKDYSIGFNERKGVASLSKQVSGKFKQYNLTVNYVGCGRDGLVYAFGTTAIIDMGENASGPNNKPCELNLYSLNESVLLDGVTSVRVDNPGFSTAGVSATGGFEIPEEQLKLGAEQQLASTFVDGSSAVDAGASFKADVSFGGGVRVENDEYIDLGQIDGLSGDIEFSLDGDMPNFSIEAVRSLMIEYSLQLPEGKRAEAQLVIDKIAELEEHDLRKLFAELANVKTIATQLLKGKIDELLAELTAPIEAEIIKVNAAIKLEIDAVVADITAQVDLQVGGMIDRVGDQVIGLAQNEKFDISEHLEKVKIAIRTAIVEEIVAAIEVSVNNNITLPITSLIHDNFIVKIRSDLSASIAEMGIGVFDEGASAIKLDNITGDLTASLEGVGQNFAGAFKPENLAANVSGLATDLFAEISVDDIYNRLVAELMNQSAEIIVEAFVEEFGEELAGELAGELLGNLAANVDLDFDGLGTMLKDGDVGAFIKLDPTNIKISTSVVDLQGQINFTEDDPIYGNSWGGQLDIYMKIQPSFRASASFLKGKVDGYHFWYFDLGVSGLNIPMLPTPFIFDGAEGRVYQHMREQTKDVYVPDKYVKVGAGLTFDFFDSPMRGQIIKFDVTAYLEVYPDGFEIGMKGDASVGNFGGFTLMNGYGELSYNSVNKHFLGMFEVSTNTAPVLCAGGGFRVEVKPDYWQMALGTREAPVFVSPLCTDAFLLSSWFDINKYGIDFGTYMNFQLRLATPYIGFSFAKVKFAAEAGFQFGISAIVDWKPLGVREARIWLEIYAGIKAYWKTKLFKGDIWLARVYIAGDAGFQTIERTRIYGGLKAKVTVLGFSVGFKFNMDHTF